jgi:hypothetical protein
LFRRKWATAQRILAYRAHAGQLHREDAQDVGQTTALLLWQRCCQAADPTTPPFEISVSLVATEAFSLWRRGDRWHTLLSQCGSTADVHDPPGRPLTVKVDGVDMGVVDARMDDPAAYRLAVASDWLTGQEVARLLGITRQRVHQIADRLGGARVGGRWRFPAGCTTSGLPSDPQ